MDLSNYLSPEFIIAPLKSENKKDALKELVDYLAESHGIASKEGLLESLMERESCASTFLPIGVAVPHARTELVDDIVMVAGSTPKGIIDEGDNPVNAYMFFLFFSPTHQKEFGRHLKLLAKVAAVFNDPAFAKELASQGDAKAIYARLKDRELDLEAE